MNTALDPRTQFQKKFPVFYKVEIISQFMLKIIFIDITFIFWEGP